MLTGKRLLLLFIRCYPAAEMPSRYSPSEHE